MTKLTALGIRYLSSKQIHSRSKTKVFSVIFHFITISQSTQVLEIFWHVAFSLQNQRVPPTPAKHLAMRMLSYIWFAFCLITVCIYMSEITSSVTILKMDPGINSIKKLLNSVQKSGKPIYFWDNKDSPGRDIENKDHSNELIERLQIQWTSFNKTQELPLIVKNASHRSEE